MTESDEAAMTQRPSAEKQRSLILPVHPDSSRMTRWLEMSTTRIAESLQASAIRSLGRWYTIFVRVVMPRQSISWRRVPFMKSQN